MSDQRYPFQQQLGEVVYTVRLARRDLAARGECDSPRKPNPEIRVRRGLPPIEVMEVLIHEAMHALHWQIAEEVVLESAIQIADMLDKAGVGARD